MRLWCKLTWQEVEDDEQTKTLMTMLPRLIAKNQSDPARIGAVLVLVEAMKLDLYLDMRKVAVSSVPRSGCELG